MDHAAASVEGEVASWLSCFGGDEGLFLPVVTTTHRCPHLSWAASGAMMVTGSAEPTLAPGPVVPMLGAVDEYLRRLTSRLGTEAGIEPNTVLGARTGFRGTARRRTPVKRTSRLVKTFDGWAAVSLARADDVDAVPAMFETVSHRDPWVRLGEAAATRTSDEFVERIRLFGVPAAVVPERAPVVEVPWRATRISRALADASLDGALVVDLSSLWAGPLCGQILGRAGARVVKVESTRRPDGARAGEPRLFDWLHVGQESVAVDFTLPRGRALVAELIGSADFVIEASRPRAFAQLGLSHDQLDLRAGAVWVSITGHGRGRPDLVAFGDDAAAAGGLLARSRSGPAFCADAIADPLTGVIAALAALASRASGGGHLLDVAMSEVAAAFAGAEFGCPGVHPIDRRRTSWFVRCVRSGDEQRVLGPRVPQVSGHAQRLGADNDRWLARSRA